MNPALRRLSMAALALACALGGACADTSPEVPTEADRIRPILPGMPAPEFHATRPDGSDYHFDPSDLDKPTVITFYRGGWCPYCNGQLADMRRAEKQLTGMGLDLLFLSADRAELLEPSLEEKNLRYTLLSDNKMEAARAFGVAFVVDAETLKRYVSKGIDLEEASGMSHHQLPVPASFIVGTDGLVHFQYANPNYKMRIDPELLIQAAKLYLLSIYLPKDE